MFIHALEAKCKAKWAQPLGLFGKAQPAAKANTTLLKSPPVKGLRNALKTDQQAPLEMLTSRKLEGESKRRKLAPDA